MRVLLAAYSPWCGCVFWCCAMCCWFVQVAVLAGSIEAAAGDVNAARALFMRAYQLQKADKQLYMVWPRMEGAAGNFERARALFQAGLSLYPNNTKILNLYACFEEDQGNVELARQLHRNALDIDGSSSTAMHNRWGCCFLRTRSLHAKRPVACALPH